MRKKSLTLVLTQNCNLNCSYCYETRKSDNRISFDLACDIISQELNDNDKTDYVDINLFGGEPFLEFDLIQEIFSYVTSKNHNKAWKFSTITNGTLVHGSVQKWLAHNKDKFVCVLSLDGNRHMHNINRNNSFDDIDLDFFLHCYPDPYIKMTISEKTLNMLYDGVVYCHERGFKIANNLAYGINWFDHKVLGILQQQLEKLANYYLDNIDIQPCSMFDFPYREIFEWRDEPHRLCSAGHELCAYDVDGKKYPCHMFMPMTNSNGNNASEPPIIGYDVNIKKIDKVCKKCPLLSVCQTCYGSNYIETGNIYHRNHGICQVNKIVFKVSAYLKALQWKQGLLQMSEGEERSLLNSILMVENIE